MNTKSLLFAAGMLGWMAWNGFAAAGKPVAKDLLLAPGNYTAKVSALVCRGCAPMIEETLKKNPAIDSVSVDDKAREVRFSVKKGSKLETSEVQNQLKESSDQMGMGADYRLKELKKIR